MTRPGLAADQVGRPPLGEFLTTQRLDRLRRVREIGTRLASLGYAVDVDALLESAGRGSRSIGRPAIADALVAAGHAANRNDAFGRFLGRGQPAFVPRAGVSGATVIQVIHEAGGIASLAHPIRVNGDISSLMQELCDSGMNALEAYHSDHDARHTRFRRHGANKCDCNRKTNDQ